MKVYFISRGYPTDRYKMHGIFEMDQAKALVKAGVEVIFLSLDLRSIRRKRKLGYHNFTTDGVKVYSLDWPVGGIYKPLFYRIGEIALNRLYERVVKVEGRPDILHAYFTDYGYLGALLKRKTGIPLVMTEPNSHINVEQIEQNLKRAAEYAYKSTDALISVSPDFQRKLMEKFGVDSTVNSILPDLKLFRFIERENDGIFRIVSTGRLAKLKGMKELIDGYYGAFGANSGVSLTIYGGGPEEADLRDQIERLGLTERVELKGLVHREEIAKGYMNSDLFCLCSHMETFGLAYLEALAAGLPVITTKCGGPEHLVDETNGILVDLFDREQLINAMIHMRAHSSEYDRASISKNAKTKYSEEAITGRIIEIYNEVLSRL